MREVYSMLLDCYGLQGWWPVTADGDVVARYTGGPTTDTQRVEVMVGAILTQNTSWTNVEKALANLNRDHCVTIDALSSLPRDRLASLIKPAGYYNQKAQRLQMLAQFLLDNPFSVLDTTETEDLRHKFLSLNGIGPETADSILLYAFNRPVFVIDAYTKRIFSRLGLFDGKTYDEWQAFFHKHLKEEVKMFQEYHALIVEHAKRFCKTKPACGACPLRQGCSYRRTVGMRFFHVSAIVG